MSYEVKIIADSIAPHGGRLTTFQLRYPRMIHSEFMTHRALSRNASSTRAIPMEKQIQSVMDNPAAPVYWGKNQRGMQAGAELDEEGRKEALENWSYARNDAVDVVDELVKLGVHKQLAGRLLEPFAHISVVATSAAPGWMNFFALRCNSAAMPEIQALAVPMARAYRDSQPEVLAYGDLHAPYLTDWEREELRSTHRDGHAKTIHRVEKYALKCSVARCARVSYLTHDNENPHPEKDAELHDSLANNGHWSPFEHQAWSAIDPAYRSGNLVGWQQYRQMLAVNVHKSFDFSILDRVYGDKDFVV